MSPPVRTPTAFRHRLASAVTGVAIALALSACATTGNDTKRATYGMPDPMQNLTANQWVLNAMESNLPPSAVGTTITFTTSGTLFGSGPCNSYRGDFTLDAAAVTISGVKTTLRTCDAPAMSAEHRYLQALASVHTVTSTNRDELKLTGGPNLVLVYAARVPKEPSKG